MKYNLANIDLISRDKINVDLCASSVAFKERYKIPVNLSVIEQAQPSYLRRYFRNRVYFYRKISKIHFSSTKFE